MLAKDPTRMIINHVVSLFELYVITCDESNAPVGIVKFFLYKPPESISAAG